jgi:hypothetical protein
MHALSDWVFMGSFAPTCSQLLSPMHAMLLIELPEDGGQRALKQHDENSSSPLFTHWVHKQPPSGASS